MIALVYGYIPYMILPLFAALDRIDQRQIEAARDLGASPRQAFMRVTLPLSKAGILAGSVLIALPMFGDYYTADLISGSAQTSMIGNQIDQFTRQGSQKTVGAVLTDAARDRAARADALLPALDPRGRAADGGGLMRSSMLNWLRNPWGRPRALVLITGVYIAWSILPVVDRDPVRVQRRPLAHDLAGLLAPLVHGRPVRQRAARSRPAVGAQAHDPARDHLGASSRRRSA